jgi:hypothetical protein
MGGNRDLRCLCYLLFKVRFCLNSLRLCVRFSVPWCRLRCSVKDSGAAPYASTKLRSANSRTVSTCSRVTPGYQSRKSLTVAPSSRFSKSNVAGTCVPLNRHILLDLPGPRSTTVHSLQSSIVDTINLPKKNTNLEAKPLRRMDFTTKTQRTPSFGSQSFCKGPSGPTKALENKSFTLLIRP